MLTLRQRLFIIVSIAVLLIVGILLYLNYRRTSNQIPALGQNSDTLLPEDAEDAGGASSDEQGTVTPPKDVSSQPYSEDLYVRQLAKIFVERFASYSTQNDNGHITDSLELASASMQTWMQSQAKENSRDYEGVVTSVFATKLVEKTATSATVAIQAKQKWERKPAGSTAPTVVEDKQRNGRVTLVKVNDKWLIDGLFWDN